MKKKQTQTEAPFVRLGEGGSDLDQNEKHCEGDGDGSDLIMHLFLKGSFSVQRNQVRSGDSEEDGEGSERLPVICCVRAITFSFSHFL